jgi:NADH-quinone oxidoreductase subunit H
VDLTDILGPIFGNVINVIVFMAKGWLLVFVMMWVRWTLPRLRIDQVMMTCLKYLLPISCVLLVGVSLWQLAMPRVVLDYLRFVIAALSVFGLVFMVFRAATTTTMPPMGGMPGAWGPGGVPKYGVVHK